MGHFTRPGEHCNFRALCLSHILTSKVMRSAPLCTDWCLSQKYQYCILLMYIDPQILLGHLNPNIATFEKSSNLMAQVGGLSATWCKYENTLQPHTLQNYKIFNFKTTCFSLIDKWIISTLAMYIFMHLASTLQFPFDFIS